VLNVKGFGKEVDGGFLDGKKKDGGENMRIVLWSKSSLIFWEGFTMSLEWIW